MLLTTPITISQHPHPITYNSYVMSWGSCFAESMGEKFLYYKIPSTVNPFGILFHPLAIEKVLKRVAEEIPFTEKDIFYHNEQWHSFEVHSCLSHSNKDVFLNRLNQILAETKSQLLKTTHFIITYGTAWVYRLKETQQYVANCHKVPQNQFDKELISIDILEKSIQNNFPKLKKHVQFYNRMPNKDLLYKLANDNVLLLFNYYSFMGTKIYDYLGIKRKILFCFTNDKVALDLKNKYYHVDESDSPNLNMQVDLIQETNSGILVSNHEQLKVEFINLCNEFAKHKKIECNSINTQKFSRRLQIEF